MFGRINFIGASLMAMAVYDAASDMGAAVTALNAKVDKLKTTDDSVVAWAVGIKGLVATQAATITQQAADLAAAGVDVTKLQASAAALTALGDSIDAEQARLAIVATA